MVQDTPSRKLDQYIVRFPDGMRDRLKLEAASNNRSLNAEIIARLDQSFNLTEVDLTNEAVQKVMVERMKEVMGTVVENLREEQRKTAGLPLLLKWFEQNPKAKADYDALRPIDQEAFVADKVHELWINHLNEKRAADGTRKAAEPARQRRVRLDDK